MAGSAKFIEYNGTRILMFDFAQCELEEMVPVIREGKQLIAAEPEKSVLTLTDVTGARNNSAAARVMKELAAYNKPYVKAAAVVGLDGLKRIALEAVARFSGRNLTAFDDIEKAMVWLAQQKAG